MWKNEWICVGAVGEAEFPLTTAGVFWVRVTIAGSSILILSPSLKSFWRCLICLLIKCEPPTSICMGGFECLTCLHQAGRKAKPVLVIRRQDFRSSRAENADCVHRTCVTWWRSLWENVKVVIPCCETWGTEDRGLSKSALPLLRPAIGARLWLSLAKNSWEQQSLGNGALAFKQGLCPYSKQWAPDMIMPQTESCSSRAFCMQNSVSQFLMPDYCAHPLLIFCWLTASISSLLY